ncbi:MAG TPA: acyltransferase [Tepidisphaeraceae bacterium]|jgi:peptidoglycan/LPS O-acetylase OafA/YrhL|nr:acyltransferase [Tepidisphaeraceae bacterium]
MTEAISIPAVGVPAAPGQRRRIGGLDVLRGMAALAVLVYHYTYNYQRLFHERKTSSPLEYGAMGVELFFIISGFVIFMTLEKTRRPIDFVRSRFSRLYPAYWAAVILTFLVLTVFKLPEFPGVDHHKYHPTLSRALLNLTMCQEMFGKGDVDAVYWTLQLELCFYFLMFILFSWKQLARVEFYLLGVLALSEVLDWKLPAGAPLLNHHHLLDILVSDLKLLTVTSLEPRPHPRLHFFIIGIMLYKLSTHFNPRHLIVLGICLAYSAFREFGAHGTDFFFTLGFTALAFSAARGWLAPLENRVTLFLGTISYSLYLTHQNIGYEILHALERRGVSSVFAILVAASVALVVATVLTYAIEQPALRFFRGKKAVAHGNVTREPVSVVRG